MKLARLRLVKAYQNPLSVSLFGSPQRLRFTSIPKFHFVRVVLVPPTSSNFPPCKVHHLKSEWIIVNPFGQITLSHPLKMSQSSNR